MRIEQSNTVAFVKHLQNCQAAFHSLKTSSITGVARDFSSEGLACSILKVFLSFTVAMWVLPRMCLIAIIERVADVAQLDRVSTGSLSGNHDSVQEGEIWLRRRDEIEQSNTVAFVKHLQNCSSCVSFSENFLDYRGKLRDFSSEGLACSILKVFLSFTLRCEFCHRCV